LTQPIDSEHVPPQQLFAPKIRKKYKPLQLLTIRAHRQCNQSYQLDEDYFVYSLMPFARGSCAGDEIYKYILEKFRRDKNVKLVHKVLKEFELRPTWIVLPPNKIIKRYEGERIRRVAWKIVRGLYFHHHGAVLPESLTVWCSVITPDEQSDEQHPGFFLPGGKSYGQYPGVFDYLFQTFTEGNESFQYWALLLWDRIIITIIFPNPAAGSSGS
jgi:hypothetical protein